MSMRCWITGVVLVTGVGFAVAQPPAQPYAGLETRDIKALSQDDIDGLKAGRGMGLALAAELNGFPGPMHVLELADALKLTPEQRAGVEASMATMRAAARDLGARIVDAETHLDRRFAMQHIDATALSELTAKIAALQGELRRVHLAAHLDMKTILTDEQVKAYIAARGYAGGASPGHGHHGHMKH
jgi:Spy/CpxP family protein refolding chaperone